MQTLPDATPAAETVSSRLLAEALQNLGSSPAPTVLDFGPGNADTLAHLGRYGGRIIFADLLDTVQGLASRAQTLVELPRDARATWLRQALHVPLDRQIDVCLFWDVLHCLPLPLLQGIGDALHPYLAPGCRAYAFGALHNDGDWQHNTYGIIDHEHLRLTPQAPLPSYHVHSQQSLTEHLPGFQIARGTLLLTGRLELLLTT